MMFFPVTTQPHDLQAMQTVAVIHALANEVPRGMALTMVDIEFYMNEHPHVRDRPFAIDEWREILEITDHQTRAAFLRQVGLQAFCSGRGTTCLVTHRGALWAQQDRQKRTIRDGDCLVVKVKKSNTQQTVQEQSRAANGQCFPSADSDYVRRVTQWDRRQHGGVPTDEEEENIADNVP